MVEIKFKKVHEDAKLPHYAHPNGDSGLDVYAVEECFLAGGQVTKVRTGLQLASITPGYELQARPRSGNTLNYGMLVSNSPGTIDNHYRGEICILMHAIGFSPLQIKKGAKIAQLVPIAVPVATCEWTEEVGETARAGTGFGGSDDNRKQEGKRDSSS